MSEPIRIMGSKKGSTDNEQLQAQVLSLVGHNALAIGIVDDTGIQYSSINPVPVTISTGDIEIGAVELKDATTDNRAVIDSSGNVQVEVTSAANLPLPSGASTESTLADCKTALQVIDNFISGTKGLVTEDNSSSILTALQTIDNFISGSRGLVTEDNSAAIKTALEIMDDWDSSDKCKVAEQGTPTVKPNALKIVNVASYDVDGAGDETCVFDASSQSTAVAVTICNAGAGNIYLFNTSSVSSTNYFKMLSSGESWEFPLGYTSDATNDIYAVRAADETADNVLVVIWGEV